MEYYFASGLRTVTKHKRPLYKYKNSLFLSFTFLNWAAVGKLKEIFILPYVSTKLVHVCWNLGRDHTSVIMYVHPSFIKRCMGTRLDNEKQLCNYTRKDTHVHIYGVGNRD
jgi:hypothetical protein